MPWQEQSPMDSRIRFISDYLSEDYSISELSFKHGISRKTAYKWIERYDRHGADGLKELSRRPHLSPCSTDPLIVRLLLELKHQHIHWGPCKLIAYLNRHHPDMHLPCVSTAGAILKRHNLVKPRKRVSRVPDYNQHLIFPEKPNDVWGADFKGQFRTGDNLYCYPLTITDLKSRYLVNCTGLSGTNLKDTMDCFKKAFTEYGLPVAIRTDNGVPFAGRTAGGLSQLSLWWVKLGIVPERIHKGKPQQNGTHERFHRTLKQETAINPRANLKCQQLLFESFRNTFNHERPHQALDYKVPSECYSRSERRYTGKIIKPQYDYRMKVRKVKDSGEIKFGACSFYLSQLIAGEHVGLKEVGEDVWDIYYSFHKLAQCNIRNKQIKRT